MQMHCAVIGIRIKLTLYCVGYVHFSRFNSERKRAAEALRRYTVVRSICADMHNQ